MKLPSIGNTLFLRELLEGSTIDDLLSGNYAEHGPVVSTARSYKPKQTRGIGAGREGYCELCCKWFRLKTSSYWYHMNYKHGIDSRGKKYPEPILRERDLKTEAYCEECGRWIVLASTECAK